MTLTDWLTHTKEICERATEGPWFYDSYRQIYATHPSLETIIDDGDPVYPVVLLSPQRERDKNMDFAAHSRQALPLALQVIEKATEILKSNCFCEKLHPDIGGKCYFCLELADIEKTLLAGEGG